MNLTDQFDENASERLAFIGPYPDLEVMARDCVITSQTPGHDDYLECADKYGFDVASGSLITTAYSPFLLDARFETLRRQLSDYHADRTGGEQSANDDKIPAFLSGAFERAAAGSSTAGKNFEVVTLSTARSSPFFILDKQNPQLNMHVTVVVPMQDYADKCNNLIAAEAPELGEKLHYVSEWQGKKSDFVFVNAYIPYLQENEVRKLVNDIAAVDPAQIVISNVLSNQHPLGKPYCMGQVYGGGAIPIRVSGYDELEKLMRDTDYSLVGQSRRPFSSHIDSERAIAKAGTVFSNYHFIRNEPVL